MRTERPRARDLQGLRAGFVSRVAAAAIDVSVVFFAFFAVLAGAAFVRYLASDEPFELPDPGAILSGTAILVALVVVLTITWSGSGRTVGNATVGLRVVTESGETLTWRRAVVRAVIVVALPIVSMGWILVSRKNAGWHDLVCRTAVVYDWRPRSSPSQSRATPFRDGQSRPPE